MSEGVSEGGRADRSDEKAFGMTHQCIHERICDTSTTPMRMHSLLAEHGDCSIGSDIN